MKRPFRTLAIVLLGGVLAFVVIFLLLRPSSAAWSEVGVDDPRVAGVFVELRARGLGPALDSLDRLAAADSGVLRSGHQLAHALGREAMALTGNPAVLAECRPVLGSGCYHGVVEAFLSARGRIDMQELEQMCVGGPGSFRPGQVYECMHGLGHGVLGALGEDYVAALDECDDLTRTQDRSSCAEGVFMEAIDVDIARQEGGSSGSTVTHPHASHSGHNAKSGAGLAIDPTDPYSPCDAIGEPWASSCWLFQGFVLLRRTQFDAAAAFRACDGAPSRRVDRCYESIGHQLTGLFQRGDSWIVAQCAKGNAILAPRCAAGATLALNAMDWSGQRTSRFCAAVPAAWRETCYAAGATTLAYYATASDLTRFQDARQSSIPTAGR